LTWSEWLHDASIVKGGFMRKFLVILAFLASQAVFADVIECQTHDDGSKFHIKYQVEGRSSWKYEDFSHDLMTMEGTVVTRTQIGETLLSYKFGFKGDIENKKYLFQIFVFKGESVKAWYKNTINPNFSYECYPVTFLER
jgi:hypothetical protein